jgi:hypothetical protein
MTFSPLARPPIQAIETEGADTAICPYHKGLIRETGDKEGTVFFCPIGRQYWRYTKQRSGMYAPIQYPKYG